jgi:hypothetical protein
LKMVLHFQRMSEMTAVAVTGRQRPQKSSH